MANTVLRPTGRKGLVFITPVDGPPPSITLPDGTVITAEKAGGGRGVYKGPSGYQWIFPGSAAKYFGKGVKLSYGDDTIDIELTAGREYRKDGGGPGISNLRPAPNKDKFGGSGTGVSTGGSSDLPTMPLPGETFGGGFDNAGNALPTAVDPSNLAAGQIVQERLPESAYRPIDPRVFNQAFAQYNRSEIQQNLQDAQSDALQFIDTEIAGNEKFATSAAALQQGLVAQENVFNRGEVAAANAFNPSQVEAANAFNQGQLNNAISASGMPIRETINEGLARSRTLAKGFLPTSLEDRAFEMAAASSAADSLQARGLGTSSFTQNAIDKYTIAERLQLMNQGNNDVDRYLARGASLLIDSPIKYNPLLNQPNFGRTSQDIRGIPSLSGSQLASSQLAARNQLTTMSPQTAMQFSVNQDQFLANDVFRRQAFNSQMNFNVQSTNVGNNLQVDLTKLNVQINNAALATQYAREAAARARGMYNAQLGNQFNTTANVGNNAMQAGGTRSSTF